MEERADNVRPSLGRRVTAHFERLGGMLVSPRTTIRRLVDRDEGNFFEVLFWLLVLAAAATPLRTGRAILVGRGGALDGLLLFLTYQQERLLGPVIGIMVAGLLLSAVARPGRLTFGRATDVVAFLLVPTMLLTAVGILLRAVGYDVWFLPHQRLRGWMSHRILFVAVSYGWSLVLFAWLMLEVRRPAVDEASAGEGSPAP